MDDVKNLQNGGDASAPDQWMPAGAGGTQLAIGPLWISLATPPPSRREDDWSKSADVEAGSIAVRHVYEDGHEAGWEIALLGHDSVTGAQAEVHLSGEPGEIIRVLSAVAEELQRLRAAQLEGRLIENGRVAQW